MANKQINDCTEHKVILCPKAKEIVMLRKASITRQSSVSDAVNKIILEYEILKDHQRL